MARRPRVNDDDISLFPFLSIIASVIGVLTMMIATISLAQTDTPDVALIEKYEQVQKELAEADERLNELQREISVSNSSAIAIREQKQQLAITVQELETLLKELEEVEKELAAQKEVEIVIPKVDPKLRESVADMQTQYAQLQEQLAQLEKELQERQDRSQAQVTILPQGTGLDYVPLFVECASDTVVMHHLPEPKRIRTAEIVKDNDFVALMQRVANSKDDTIVFLVRSDGLSTYRACQKLCNDNEVRNGKIPVLGKGRIDLSVFAKEKPQ